MNTLFRLTRLLNFLIILVLAFLLAISLFKAESEHYCVLGFLFFVVFVGLFFHLSTRFILNKHTAPATANWREAPLDYEAERPLMRPVKVWHHVLNVSLLIGGLLLVVLGVFMVVSGNFEISWIQPAVIAVGSMIGLNHVLYIVMVKRHDKHLR